MKYVSEILRGLLIGIAGIAPGVSGGALAVSMGVYDRIIGALTHMTRDTRESLKTLFPYALGAALGMSGLAFLIEVMFVRYPFATRMTFIGLILGGIPALRRKVSRKEGLKGYTAFLVVFCLMVIMVIAQGEQGMENVNLAGAYTGDFSSRLSAFICLVCAGMIAAATMVIPGVSGTMLLMMMGYYEPILSSFNRLQAGILMWNLPAVLKEQKILLPYCIGLVAGIFLCAHMVESLLKNYESLTYCIILGLVASSPIVILWGIPFSSLGRVEIAAGILSALVCFKAVSAVEG
ncbi:DUF368 domain-containing protein [Lachnospiraceae bacterium 62-35]